MVSTPDTTDYMAPTFALEVERQEVDYGITQFIRSVEYESADGMADVMRIRAINPDFTLSNAKVFQPGNEMAVWMGYGNELEFVGRTIINKQLPNFPQNDMPTIQCVGYTKDTKMMDNEPEKPKKVKGKRGKKGGRVFKDKKFSEAVLERVEDYGFKADIDDTPDAPHNFIQRPGITDYEFVNGLANLNGFVFWVEGMENGDWNLFFKQPGSLASYQEKKYTFIYNQSNDSTLLTFQPEFLVKGTWTDLEVVVKDVRSGKTLKATITEENEDAPDLSAAGDLTSNVGSDFAMGGFSAGGGGELTTASDVKIFFEDFSFSVNTSRRFKTEAEVELWAQQWFRRQRENFILSRGQIIGVGSIRARQTHMLEGVGNTYIGDYYFTKVKHTCSNDQGYIIDFGGRKVVP